MNLFVASLVNVKESVKLLAWKAAYIASLIEMLAVHHGRGSSKVRTYSVEGCIHLKPAIISGW